MKYPILPAALLAGVSLGPVAHAATVTAAIGGAPFGANRINFNDLSLGAQSSEAVSVYSPLGGAGDVFVTTYGNAAVVKGTKNKYAAPVLSGLNGAGFGTGGSDQPGGVDKTHYLTSGRTADGGMIEFTFSDPQLYMGLLWGSVDTFNLIQFYDGMTLVDTVTGTDVDPVANGDQGVDGTFYVNINAIAPFTKVLITSGQFGFELDNVAFHETSTPPPPPADPVADGGRTLALLGASLGGLAFFGRKGRRR